MYIPITKTEEKCAGQLSYGFNIQDKLEGCTHEKKIPYGDLDFWNFVYKRFGINGRVRLSNSASFDTFFYKAISFEKLTPLTFKRKILSFSEILCKGISFLKWNPSLF